MCSDRLDKLKNFLEKDPEDDFLLFAIAQEYEKKEENQKALSYYEQLLHRNKYYIGCYYHLGMLHQKLEQLEEALDIFEQGIERSKERKDLHALAELQNAKTNLEMEML